MKTAQRALVKNTELSNHAAEQGHQKLIVSPSIILLLCFALFCFVLLFLFFLNLPQLIFLLFSFFNVHLNSLFFDEFELFYYYYLPVLSVIYFFHFLIGFCFIRFFYLIQFYLIRQFYVIGGSKSRDRVEEHY